MPTCHKETCIVVTQRPIVRETLTYAPIHDSIVRKRRQYEILLTTYRTKNLIFAHCTRAMTPSPPIHVKNKHILISYSQLIFCYLYVCSTFFLRFHHDRDFTPTGTRVNRTFIHDTWPLHFSDVDQRPKSGINANILSNAQNPLNYFFIRISPQIIFFRNK